MLCGKSLSFFQYTPDLPESTQIKNIRALSVSICVKKRPSLERPFLLYFELVYLAADAVYCTVH